MATFELKAARNAAPTAPTGWAGLETRDLLRNARWFTHIRWAIIGTLTLASLAQRMIPSLFQAIGVRLPWLPLLIIALALAATNLLYILRLRRYDETTPRRPLFINLWLQILFDLAALTVIVHLSGSLTSFVSLAYLFHIVLACIFFAPPYSLLVTLLSSALFLSVVALELSGVLTPRSMLIEAYRTEPNLIAAVLHAFSAIVFWLAVWYLVAFIAQALRKRDRQLAQANQRLIQADEENNRQVLRTTHDLKAPFSGIESNILLLRTAHWDTLSEPVRDIIERIETRSAALRERIRDILILGAIKSQAQEHTTPVERIEIPDLIDRIIKEVEDKAEHHHVTITTQGDKGVVYNSTDHLTTLLGNLIANAIFYSREGGAVEITISEDPPQAVTVSIADHGIGIRDEALPHIFDEYYRTREAAQHNAMSTGLGLAIVKRIADTLGLTIRVRSQLGKGTTFDVMIPRGTAPADPDTERH